MPRFHLVPRAFFASLVIILTLFGLVFASAPRAAATPTADGLYALVSTSEGNFAIKLHYVEAPMTVANFIGLAEGSRPWLDPSSGSVTTRPFYDGVLVHRAEPGFVIQMGIPNNGPVAGPGYTFSDEFHPSLTHNAAGSVSMANSGSDSNGSQFFITLGPASFLNARHSVFGTIVEGMNVVTNIGNLPPSTVTIHSVSVLRIGAGANAFNPTIWGLPVVGNAKNPHLTLQGGSQLLLGFDRTPFTQFGVYGSLDLASWELLEHPSLIHLDSAAPTQFDVTEVAADWPEQFYRAVAIRYQAVPASPHGSTIGLLLKSSLPNQALTLKFTAPPRSAVDYNSPLGTYLLDSATSGRIGGYVWTQSLERAVCGVALEGIGIIYFNLKFNDNGTGLFTGSTTSNSLGPFPYYGSFTHGPTP